MGPHSRKDDEGVRMAVSAGLGRSGLDFKELEGRINSSLPSQWASLEYCQSPLPSFPCTSGLLDSDGSLLPA